jgi:hypothetical protein
MSAGSIILSGLKGSEPEGTTPTDGYTTAIEEYIAWRDRLAAEKGTRFVEDYLNGLIDIDGNPTEESIRAEEAAAALIEAFDRHY